MKKKGRRIHGRISYILSWKTEKKTQTKSLDIELWNALREELSQCTLSNEEQLVRLDSSLGKVHEGTKLLLVLFNIFSRQFHIPSWVLKSRLSPHDSPMKTSNTLTKIDYYFLLSLMPGNWETLYGNELMLSTRHFKVRNDCLRDCLCSKFWFYIFKMF